MFIFGHVMLQVMFFFMWLYMSLVFFPLWQCNLYLRSYRLLSVIKTANVREQRVFLFVIKVLKIMRRSCFRLLPYS